MLQLSDNEEIIDNQELLERGRTLRKTVPRKSHGIWKPESPRDPIYLLQKHDEKHLKNVLPHKYGRMLASPFSFMRGSAVVMAADLKSTPFSGPQTQLCGDAHLLNFGIFATPERKLIFDINDFDETYPGPWEWDLKRLATSAVLVGREKGFSEEINRKLAIVVSKHYQKAMEYFAMSSALDVWYYEVKVDEILEVLRRVSKKDKKSSQEVIKEALYNTELHTLEKLTEVVDGKRRFRNKPPLMVRLSEEIPEDDKELIPELDIISLFKEYVIKLPKEKQQLLSHYHISCGAFRIVGIGSVGTRCFVLLLEGSMKNDALILQLKEAGPSALEQYLPKKKYTNCAQRVIVGQKMMQAASDIFLSETQDKAERTDYYLRQFKDMKGSFNLDSLDKDGLEIYLKFCSLCLAHAHARTGDGPCISGYIGKSDIFNEAISDFAIAYADQTENDYQALKEAVKSGRIIAIKDYET